MGTDLASGCKNVPNNTTYLIYEIDAKNGEILWRDGDPQPQQVFTCQ